MPKLLFKFFITVFLITPFLVLAQDGSVGGTIPAQNSTITPSPLSRPSPNAGTEAAMPAQVISNTPVSASPSTTNPVTAPTPSTTPQPTPGTPSSGMNTLTIVVCLFAGIAAAGYLIFRAYKNNQTSNRDERSCDNIQSLLDQKKKELEEFIQKWPEEKLKALAEDEAVNLLSKNEDTKKIVETVQSLKAKHAKIKETVELLQKKYDICILSLPSVRRGIFRGTLVENSLKNKEIFNDVKVTKESQDEDWKLFDVTVAGEKLEKLGQYLADGPWYMNFWQESTDEMFVIFKDRSFKIKISDKNTWKEALEYGKSMGIPEEQLDFKIN